MKATEAPEKLYVELCSDGVYAHTREWGNSDNIEYARTDAFIATACEWLKENIEKYLVAKADGAYYKITIFEDFKNYMKGGNK